MGRARLRDPLIRSTPPLCQGPAANPGYAATWRRLPRRRLHPKIAFRRARLSEGHSFFES